MVTITGRQSLLLQLMCELDEPITGAELASLLGVSTRTLRYDITRLNRIVGTAAVISTPAGYRIGKAGYESLLASNPSLATGADTRDDVLVYLLDQPVTNLYDIARDCYLGEATVRTLLEQLSSWVAHFGLVLSVRGDAVRLSGSEFNRRRVLGQLLLEALRRGTGQQTACRKILPDVDLDAVTAAVADTLAEAGSASDLHVLNLAANVAICLQRSGHDEEKPAADGGSAGDDSTTAVAEAIRSRLERLYPSRQLDQAGRGYLDQLVALAVAGAEEPIATSDNSASDRLQAVVAQALDDTIRHFGLEVDRVPLEADILGHVTRLQARSRSLVFFRNELRDNMRTRAPYLYDIAVYLAHRITGSIDLHIDDEEIGLLAVHVGIHTTASPRRDDDVTAVLICPRYRALREGLLTRLSAHFADRLRILQVVDSVAQARRVESDLVIAAGDDPITARPTVRISALLSSIDVGAIDQAIRLVAQQRFQRRAAKLIAEFFDPALFFAGQRFESAEQAIRFLAGALTAQGYVADTFTDSVLTRERYSSTAFANRFAVPHSMEFLATQTRIAVATCPAGTPWGDSNVNLILLLAINEAEYSDFSAIYQPLIELLYDQRLFRELHQASGITAFTAFLGEHLDSP